MTEQYNQLIATLDLSEKVALLTGATMFTLHGHPGLELQPMTLSDGPTGVRGLHFSGGRRVSLLPCATVLASTWDEDTLHSVGLLLAEEAARQEVHVVLGPTINLHRSPLGGRLFEAFSEDPLLTGRLAAAYVRGLQSRGIGACLKHLVANESETQRRTVDIRVDEATLREVYLLPFEIAVTDSHPWAIMAAYNYLNGVSCTEHHGVINEVVKDEWNWDGLVMSDWFATESTAPAANGGLDLVMPGPDGPWGDALVAAVRAGEVPESVIDDHVGRLLRLADRVGALGEPTVWPAPQPEPVDDVRRQALTRLAVAGSTVVANNGVLPISDGTQVALIGRHALDTVVMGGGSAHVNPPHQISIAEGLTAVLPGTVVADGVQIRLKPVPAQPGFITDALTGEPGMRVEITGVSGAALSDQHVPEATFLVGYQESAGKSEPAASVQLTARIDYVGRVQLGVIGIGSWNVSIGDVQHEVAVRPVTGDNGEAILTPPTWSTEVDLNGPTLVSAQIRPIEGIVRTMTGLIAKPVPRPDEAAIVDAVAAARQADIAVVVVGLTEEQETEALDKSTLALPGAQDALVIAVAGAAKKTVVVVNAATPVLMPWLEQVDAVLVVGLPGQEGGHAVAAALLGTQEPAGRLVTTWPVADAASSAWSVTPVDRALPYQEGPFIGYRGHAAGRAPTPLFWFGSGLGYGTWEYTDAQMDLSDAAPVVTVALRNTSEHDSREVVQVYFAPIDENQPVRLVGWSAAHVSAGGTAEVRVPCDARMWRRWDTAAGAWTSIESGGELLVARGLGDVRHRLRIS